MCPISPGPLRHPLPSLPATHRDSTRYYSPDHVSSRFGARLRDLRRQRGWTQLRLANQFGIDRTYISDVERGRKSISLPLLEVIAIGFDLSLSDLLKDLERNL